MTNLDDVPPPEVKAGRFYLVREVNRDGSPGELTVIKTYAWSSPPKICAMAIGWDSDIFWSSVRVLRELDLEALAAEATLRK